jgi:phosphatidylinositol glycan class W
MTFLLFQLLVLLRYSIGFHCKIDNNGVKSVTSKKNDDEKIVISRNWKAAISLDFIFIVFPMLLFFTVLSEWVYHGTGLLSLLVLILSVTAKREDSLSRLEQVYLLIELL